MLGVFFTSSICLAVLSTPADTHQTCVSSPRGENYSGMRRVTAGGLFCQRWDQQHPHKHSQRMGMDSDYCRNPDGEKLPWCYTTISDVRWQYCDIPPCTGEPCLPDDDKRGRHYRGTKHVTVSGHLCQNWRANSPHEHKYGGLPNNYCRNPDNDLQPWCYTTNPDKRWDYCYVPSCTAPSGPCLTEADPRGRNYRGTVSETADGTPCQRWSTQSPHEHKYASQGHHNYCRNPDNEPSPWCYTTNPSQRWALCNIRRCY